jgi:hypothetical protein
VWYHFLASTLYRCCSLALLCVGQCPFGTSTGQCGVAQGRGMG